MGDELSILADSAAEHGKIQAQLQMPVVMVRRGVENAGEDLHAALRDGGCRLVGSSMDFDGAFYLSISFYLLISVCL
jgi:hypothetical protein